MSSTVSPARPRRYWPLLLGLLVLLGVLLTAGLLPRLGRAHELDSDAREARNSALPVVVGHPYRGAAVSELTLPGTIQALRQTSVFARATGYVRQWTADIGTPVKAGQVLATLDVPDLQQDVEQARVNRDLAKTNLDRVRSVTLPGAVAQSDVDQRLAAFNAADAGLKRLETLTAYRTITAPTSGVVTKRNIETGMLVNSGNAGMELYRVEETDLLKIAVDVPQTYLSATKVGNVADILVREYPDKVFKGKVFRNAGSLEPVTRTLRTEIQIPNVNHVLLPGLFVNVRFHLNEAAAPLMVPAKTLKIGTEGTQVASVINGKIKLLPVQIGRDFGSEVEILSGLTGHETLVLNPTDRHVDGVAVAATEAPKPQPEGGKK